ncbi:MAG: hypothetical protein EZS28_050720, partial [Streblomastix strix]
QQQQQQSQLQSFPLINTPDVLCDEPLYDSIYEYTAMGKIIKYVCLYIFIMYSIGFIWIYTASSLLPWMQDVLAYQLEEQGISAVRFSIFAVVSSFNNAGFAILEGGGLSDIRGQWAVILPIGLLIAAGHTMFPVFFRLMIEITKDKGGSQRPIYHYLMVSSRKCYTHMFSSVQTRTLAYLFGLITLIQLIPLLGIDWKQLQYEQEEKDYSGFGNFILAFVFSINTRAAGFSFMEEEQLHVGVLWILIAAMFFGPYPFIM